MARKTTKLRDPIAIALGRRRASSRTPEQRMELSKIGLAAREQKRLARDLEEIIPNEQNHV